MTLSEAIETAQKDASTWAQFDARAESAQAQYKQVESHWWPIVSIDSSLLFWTDVSKLEVIDKEEMQTNLTNSLAEASQQVPEAMLPLLQQFMPAAQTVAGSLMNSLPESFLLKDDITFTIGATVKMPLTPLFKVYQAGKLAQVGIDNIEVERRAKALSINNEVTEVYLKLVYAQLMNDVAQEAYDTIEKHVEMAQKYESAGMISHTDVLSAEVELLKSKQNIVEARNSTKLAGLKLAQVLSLGRGVQVKALGKPQETFSVQLDSLESYQQQAIENRTELERIELGREAASRKKKIALYDYIPQVALIGSYQYAAGVDILDPSHQGLIGLMMSWTVFDGLGHYYEAKQASLESTELESKADEARELIELEVAQKYLALQTALERVELTQQALALAEENLRTVTAQFAQGESVNTDVLTAQAKHTAAKADDVKARIDILIAYAELKLSLGQNPTLDENALK
ncbi:MAG: TolC family protein [Proteobacteria bacterium]|nr:TolC family protein [Pseudomonadota bacterium]